jgi:hypothetical protein
MIDEERPCAAHNRIECWCLKNDARVRSSSELAQVRTQINPPPIQPAPSAPATPAGRVTKGDCV